MPVLYANRAFSTLASSITNVATSLSVAAGQGARFPAITAPDYFYATLDNNAGNVEIVKVTARSTDTFTIVRAQDGTSALAFNAGAGVELRVVKAMLDDFKIDAVSGTQTLGGVKTFSSPIQGTGHINSWGTTNGTATGALNVPHGASNSATWLLSSTVGGAFAYGIQAQDTGTGATPVIRFYDQTRYFQFGSNVLSASGVAGTSWAGVYSAGDLRLWDSDSTHYVGFKSPATVAANNIWTLPAADGTAGQALVTDGADNLSWSSNVATATALQTARTIGGVSFNGTANIDLPGVNTAGNQNTSGSAATLTTTRTLWGQNFNGSANVSGNLTSVGNITGTAGVTLTATSAQLTLAATGANSVSIQTNGVERLRAYSGGGVLINDTIYVGRTNTTDEGGQINLQRASDNASMYALDVYGSTATPVLRLMNLAAGTTLATIDSSGNLGIGTNSPAAKLDVNGNTSVTGNVSLTGSVVLANDQYLYWGVGDGSAYVRGNSSSDYISFGTVGSERMRLDASGNLCIGSAISLARLSIGTTATSNSLLGIHIGYSSSFYGYRIINDNTPSSTAAGKFAIQRGTTSSWVDVITSDDQGRVGINTSSPASYGQFAVLGGVTYTIPNSFAGASGNNGWSVNFGSQAITSSIFSQYSTVTQNVYTTSDERMKRDVTALPPGAGLAFVESADPISFAWATDGQQDTGFIAQRLMAKGYGHLVSAVPDWSMKEMVHEDGNVSPAGCRFVVRYDSIVPILSAAIRDQQALITNLIERVRALEAA